MQDRHEAEGLAEIVDGGIGLGDHGYVGAAQETSESNRLSRRTGVLPSGRAALLTTQFVWFTLRVGAAWPHLPSIIIAQSHFRFRVSGPFYGLRKLAWLRESAMIQGPSRSATAAALARL